MRSGFLVDTPGDYILGITEVLQFRPAICSDFFPDQILGKSDANKYAFSREEVEEH